MKVLHDADADLTLLNNRCIAVIGYGNQGRAQALNLRDSGCDVIVGNIADAYADRARGDHFTVKPITEAVSQADIVMLLIPDEVMPSVFEIDVAPFLRPSALVDFASGYCVTFEQLTLPPMVDGVLLAPRMIGAGVRDLYLAGKGYPAFIGVAQDISGHARDLALALAKGIGATRMGVVEVTFAQEAELDLFTEQCFGPAFGAVLTSSVNLLIDQGYPPEAVLLELYMSGEFAYTLGKIAEMGLVEQSSLHSSTSQYGSMSRGMQFQLPELRARLREGLEHIRSGGFAREWVEEQAEGAPTLEILREQARAMPLYAMEKELRAALSSPTHLPAAPAAASRKLRLLSRIARLLGLDKPQQPTSMSASSRGGYHAILTHQSHPIAQPLATEQLEAVIRRFLSLASHDAALQGFAENRDLDTHYVLFQAEEEAPHSFYLGFHQGIVTGELGAPPAPAQVQLTLSPATLDGMFTSTLNPARAAMSGEITFSGDARTALTVQRIQKDLIRLYSEARQQVLEEQVLEGTTGEP